MREAADGLHYGRVSPGMLVPDHLLSHSNSFGFEMEKDAAGCRALNRNFIVGEYHIENIKQLSEKTYAVVQWIPDSGEGRVYLIELGREEIDFIKKEMPLSMGVAVYKEIFSGNTIVFGAVSDKVWKDFDSEPEQVNFTKVEILYSGGKEQETVNNFSGFLFCIPGEKYIDDVLFYSGDEVIAKLSDLPLGENVVENFNR